MAYCHQDFLLYRINKSKMAMHLNEGFQHEAEARFRRRDSNVQ